MPKHVQVLIVNYALYIWYISIDVCLNIISSLINLFEKIIRSIMSDVYMATLPSYMSSVASHMLWLR